MAKQLVILFVCSGNTCRSVMAQGLFKKIWENSGEKQVQLKVHSAGMETIDGLKATDKALEVLYHEGVDLSSHRSRKITSSLIEEADHIFSMTMKQKKMLVDSAPSALPKIWQLFEFAGSRQIMDLPDPYGQSMEYYSQTVKELKTAIRRIVYKLKAEQQEEKTTGKIACSAGDSKIEANNC